MPDLPVEVTEKILFLFGAKNGFPGIIEVDPKRVVFCHKQELSRCEGWMKAVKTQPLGDKNPWRKCHTENYWAWYLVEN